MAACLTVRIRFAPQQGIIEIIRLCKHHKPMSTRLETVWQSMVKHVVCCTSGKIGAIIAQCVLGPLINHGCPADQKNCWLNHVMQIFALFMLLGVFTTLLLPETKRKTLLRSLLKLTMVRLILAS